MLGRYTKALNKTLSSNYRGFRQSVSRSTPDWARKRLDRTLDYIDLVFVDHHIFRFIYSNRHKVAKGVYRSAQPAPYQIRAWKRKGVRTIINLRGERDCGSYRLEEATCRRHGIKLINFQMQSRGIPSVQALREATEMFETVEYPIVMHCKSGADRAGIMSALYLILKEGRPPEEAIRQLSLKYGHIKQADTGILDHYIESYIHHNRDEPTPFIEWAEQLGSRKSLRKSFQAQGWANRLVNGVLKRE